MKDCFRKFVIYPCYFDEFGNLIELGFKHRVYDDFDVALQDLNLLNFDVDLDHVATSGRVFYKIREHGLKLVNA